MYNYFMAKYKVLIAISFIISSCGGGGGGGGGGSDSMPATPPAPMLNLSTSSANVNENTAFTLSWTSSNASSCTASGDWSGTKSASGNENITESTVGTKTYTLTCSGTGGSVSKSVTVNIVNPNNTAPEINTTSLTLVEHTFNAGTVNVTDADNDTLTYQISGADASSLTISSSGVVEFTTAPDYEVKNEYNFTLEASDGSTTVSGDIKINVTNYAFIYEAKERLIGINMNIPSTNPVENLCIIGLDVPARMKTFCEDVYSALHQSLGGYPNYVHVIWNANGTEANAKPVLDKISFIQNRTMTLNDLQQTCLSGHDPGGARSAESNPYSVCYETMDWTDSPFEIDGTQFQHDIALSLHYAHEYFHHYQGRHSLERGMDLQSDRNNPSTTSETPRWMIEGGAITFQNTWFRNNFKQITTFENSTWDDVKGITIASHATADMYKRIRKTIIDGNTTENINCDQNWMLTDATNDQLPDCQGWYLIVPYLAHKTSWKIVWVDFYENTYDLGFWGALEKFYGKSKNEFYADFNAFIRAGSGNDDPPSGWTPTDDDLITADFLNIKPEEL